MRSWCGAPRALASHGVVALSGRGRRGIAAVYGAGRVLSHEIEGDLVHLTAEIPERLVERYREHLS